MKLAKMGKVAVKLVISHHASNERKKQDPPNGEWRYASNFDFDELQKSLDLLEVQTEIEQQHGQDFLGEFDHALMVTRAECLELNDRIHDEVLVALKHAKEAGAKFRSDACFEDAVSKAVEIEKRIDKILSKIESELKDVMLKANAISWGGFIQLFLTLIVCFVLAPWVNPQLDPNILVIAFISSITALLIFSRFVSPSIWVRVMKIVN